MQSGNAKILLSHIFPYQYTIYLLQCQQNYERFGISFLEWQKSGYKIISLIEILSTNIVFTNNVYSHATLIFISKAGFLQSNTQPKTKLFLLTLDWHRNKQTLSPSSFIQRINQFDCDRLLISFWHVSFIQRILIIYNSCLCHITFQYIVYYFN